MERIKKISFIFVSIILLFSLSFSKEEKKERLELIDKVVLIVNGEPVLLSEVELAKLWFKTEDTRKAVNELINLILVSQQARKLGITVFPDLQSRTSKKSYRKRELFFLSSGCLLKGRFLERSSYRVT